MDENSKKVLEAIKNGLTTRNEIIKETKLSSNEVEKIISGLKEKNILKEILVLNPKHEEVNKKMINIHLYKCSGGPKGIAKAAELFSKIPYIEEVHSIVGEYDLFVKFRTESMDYYDKILNEDIWTAIEGAGIVHSMGMITIHTYKEKPRYMPDINKRSENR